MLTHNTILSGVADIHDALSQLQLHGFEYFDLELSAADQDALSKVFIQDTRSSVLFSELDRLQDRAINFMTRFALPQDLPDSCDVAEQIGYLITSAVNNILAATEADDAEVTFRAHLAEADQSTCESMPDWHVDKRHDEILADRSYRLTETRDQRLVFILSLYGPSTLFYAPTILSWQRWLAAANESIYSYGCNASDISGCADLYSLFNLTEASSPAFGQGSVHIAGREDGTLHASPGECDDRLSVIVRAGSIAAIKKVAAMA